MEEVKTSTSDDSSETDSEFIIDVNKSKTYIIGKFLGKGAHAQVFEASDRAEPTHQFALKIMTLEPSPQVPWHRSLGNKPRVKEVRLTQVMREVEIHSLMNHRNIVRLESFFQEGTRFCMVLEHCRGNSLAQLLKSIGKVMSEANSRSLINQVLDGLDHIHSRGIIHRDLKPANIYLSDRMILKIGDFGLADHVGSGRKGICGTPNYISPEALMEQGYTPAVDIWALGCIAYHLLAGKPPFEADTQNATYELIRAHRFTPLLSSQAGSGARDLINWMLSYLPEDRPSIPYIRKHVWLRKLHSTEKDNINSIKKKKRKHIIQELTKNVLIDNSSSSESTLQEPKYERLCEKVMELSIRDDNCDSKNLTFWKSLLQKVKLKKSPSFHFLPSTLLSIRTKSSLTLLNKIPVKNESFKTVLEGVLAATDVLPADEKAGMSWDVVSEAQVPVFIAKWIDYSNKFGFGYQMTDGTTGVVLNDKTQICLDGGHKSLTCCTAEDRVAYPLHSVPANMQSKLTLLENFKEYMDRNLSCCAPKHAPLSIPPVLSSWTRGTKAVVFLRSDLLQVNFISDHWKFLLYPEPSQQTTNQEYILVIIDGDKKIKKYNLSSLKETGCPDAIVNHLVYIHSIL